MNDGFDAYHKWLAIPPEEQPPNHYRLLGLRIFENDEDVIENAAEAKMLLLRSRQNGPQADACQRLMNEIAVARHCLLNEDSRESYNDRIRGNDQESPLRNPPAVPKAASDRTEPQPQVEPERPIEHLSENEGISRARIFPPPSVPMGAPKTDDSEFDDQIAEMLIGSDSGKKNDSDIAERPPANDDSSPYQLAVDRQSDDFDDQIAEMLIESETREREGSSIDEQPSRADSSMPEERRELTRTKACPKCSDLLPIN